MQKFLPNYLIGVDEVGRGPIAGPVAVGAFIFINPDAGRFFRGVKESKQLIEEEREEWYEKILEVKEKGQINFSVSFQSEKVIDEMGLSYAIKKCLSDSLAKLHANPAETLILLDGGLRAPSEYIYQKTIVKGDEKEKVIALASICAKVERDRKMKKLGRELPNYGFEAHKGYGTARHYMAIKRHGLSPIHRVSFCRFLLPKSPAYASI